MRNDRVGGIDHEAHVGLAILVERRAADDSASTSAHRENRSGSKPRSSALRMVPALMRSCSFRRSQDASLSCRRCRNDNGVADIRIAQHQRRPTYPSPTTPMRAGGPYLANEGVFGRGSGQGADSGVMSGVLRNSVDWRKDLLLGRANSERVFLFAHLLGRARAWSRAQGVPPFWHNHRTPGRASPPGNRRRRRWPPAVPASMKRNRSSHFSVRVGGA